VASIVPSAWLAGEKKSWVQAFFVLEFGKALTLN